MSPALFAAVAVAGGFGSVCRLVVDGIIRSRTGGTLPWGTIVINLTGSFVLGVVTGLAVDQVVSDSVQMIVGTGFLGGYTTFSTASFETVRLLQQRRWVAGGVNGAGVLVGATCAAGLGLWIGALG